MVKSSKARPLLFPDQVTLQSYAIQKAQQLGAKVVTCSDSNGWVYDPEGIDVAALKEIKEVNRARLTEYAENIVQIQNIMKDAAYGAVKVDLALPCATQNELHLEDAQTAGSKRRNCCMRRC